MRQFRIVFASVVALLMLAFAACGGDEDGDVGAGDTTGATGATTEATGETAAIPEFTTLEEGVLTVGSCLDYKPFEWVEQGDEMGFDVDLTEEIAARLGLEVEWVRANFETIFTAVAGHQFDLVSAAVTATGDLGAERAQTVAFSDLYFNSLQSMAVNPEEQPDLTSYDQLGEGDVVGVQRGTTGKSWAEENLEPNGVEVKAFTTAPDAFRDLQAGRVDAVINDEPASQAIVEDFPPTTVIQSIDTDEKYAFAFAQDTPELVAAVNQALQEVIDDGTYAEIFEEYFPTGTVPEEYQPAA